MGALAPFLARLAAEGAPGGEPGALRAAWDTCDDVDEMIALLRQGAAVKAFEVDTVTEYGTAPAITRWLFRLRSAGRYYRIDVKREDGADGVRRCFPDFPDDWTPLLGEGVARDPLGRLRWELRAGLTPTVDRDAAQAAWASCEEPFVLLDCLVALGHGEGLDALFPSRDGHGAAADLRFRQQLLAAIRARFPRPPY